MDPHNPGNYVLISNVYAAAGRWEDVEQVRMRMKVRGLKKDPGCSWIEVGNKVHTFMTRDRSHPQSDEIYDQLSQITEKLETEGGYKAQTSYVLHNVEEKEKVTMLYGHSERLALAYGLLTTSQRMPIRVTKNLRVCGDCHTFTKLVSKIFEREIIVRDANRFHHFRDGVCSCGDFWITETQNILWCVIGENPLLMA
ncbi:UNVERIFIED_CONTAM: Pentatricopeptide repeat-containing protein, chloroplastic [Sesamum angustifolium]|uniref:Pentatricopeptide repeat-containing protein, chloroplastic n=1 Tax=Sesamum angustifolium TaxID=2727405 RepID=A0AAW2QU43_9LAMI